MKNVLYLALLFFCFIMTSSVNHKSIIIFELPNYVEKEVQIGIAEVKASREKQENIRNYYIILSSSGVENSILISDYRDNHVKKLLKRTNRFIQINDKLKIPLIFDYDFRYSTFFEKKEGGRIMYNKGGYFIVFNSFGDILDKGFGH